MSDVDSNLMDIGIIYLTQLFSYLIPAIVQKIILLSPHCLIYAFRDMPNVGPVQPRNRYPRALSHIDMVFLYVRHTLASLRGTNTSLDVNMCFPVTYFVNGVLDPA